MALQAGSSGVATSSSDEKAASRMGVIEVNDLVYKLEADLSVAVNRTHKTGFFQNNTYSQSQTSIAIFNSGADYIDCRRSFLSVTINPGANPAASAVNTDPRYYAVLSYYFGPTGSVLNLIDSILITSRSGDELSRINDFGQLMYVMIPWVYGKPWAETVGENIGFGSYIGGSNSNFVQSRMSRRRFNIPLYLLSPFFTYGRLMPSMVMSGLRVEIKWKTLDTCTQQFWENTPLHRPLTAGYPDPLVTTGVTSERAGFQPPLTEAPAAFATDGMVYLQGGGVKDFRIGLGGLDATFLDTTQWDWQWTPAAGAVPLQPNAGTLTKNGGVSFFTVFSGRPYIIPGVDMLVYNERNNAQDPGYPVIFDITSIVNQDVLRVTCQRAPFGAGVANAALGAAGGLDPTSPGMYRVSKVPYPNTMQRQGNSPYWESRFLTPSTIGVTYTIDEPRFNNCSIQLSDAVQRHLNEYSSVSGLEIVFADWDRTSAPLVGAAVSVYTEVRKSASRALMVFATVVNNEANPSSRVPYASVYGGSWGDYQFQLGSLYFPQQQVKDTSTSRLTYMDNIGGTAYYYAADAWDRLHPKAAPTAVSLRGAHLDWRLVNQWSIPQYFEDSPDDYLRPFSFSGAYGSYVNGGMCVATTLERSTMFDLSGVPINNSRVLAIRGTYLNPTGAGVEPAVTNSMLYCFLKYVRLCRVFLINIEVEQ